MESADISIHCLTTTMESADVSMPLFDAQQWKVRTSAYHCLTHNNGNVNHSPHRNVNHSPHRVCFYVLHMWIKNEVSFCVESVLERSLNHSPHSLFLCDPCVDQKPSEPLCGEYP